MRVIHFIPAAFDYFNDIKSEAFMLVEELTKAGVENEVFTLQYGVQSQSKVEADEEEVQTTAPLRQFGGLVDLDKAILSLNQFDVVHLHCPFLGGAKKFLRWKKNNPKNPLVVTYYRRVKLPDFFSLIIKAYNGYYLPKIFAAADAVTCFSLDDLPKRLAMKNKLLIEADYTSEFADLDLTKNEDGVELRPEEKLAVKYYLIYNSLI